MSSAGGEGRNFVLAIAETPSAPPKHYTFTWPDIVEALAHHTQLGTPSDFENDPPGTEPRTAKQKLDAAKWGRVFMMGALRADGVEKTIPNMAAIEVLTIDLDDVTETLLGHVTDALAAFRYAWYTTHKHDARTQLWRVRFVIPLAAAVEPARYLELWHRLQVLCAGKNDPATKNANRLNYFPSSPEPARHAFAGSNNGRFLTPEDLPAVPAAPGGTREGAAGDLFEQVCKKMARKPGDIGKWFRLVFKGEELAESGVRHEIFTHLTWELAKAYPKLDDATVERIFSPSLAVMIARDPSCEPVSAIVAAYRGAVDKINAARADRKKEKQQQIVTAQGIVTSAPAPFAADGAEYSRTDTADVGSGVEVTISNAQLYKPDELAAIAAGQRCTPAELDRRWVVYKDGTYWFLGPGGYGSPHTQGDAALNIYNSLARAPIELFRTTESGNAVPKKLADLASRHGQKADQVTTHLGIMTAWLEPAGAESARGKATVFHETGAIPRIWKFDPQPYENIDTWLRVLAGPIYEKLLDWLAIFPQLDKSISGLYLCGARGVGKQLLAHGAAKIWTDGAPCPPDTVLESFNEPLVTCPFVFVDEALPKLSNTYDVTAKLREEMLKNERVLKRKFKTETTMIGNVRWMFAANDDNMLRSEGAFSRETIAAIAERFLFVDVTAEAREYLINIGQDERDAWADHKIAEHILHLAMTREVKHGQRLWVDGDVSRMTQELMHANEFASLLCEWVICYLREPNKVEQQAGGRSLIRREGGKLLVNSRAFVEFWNVYLNHERTRPSQRKIGEALVALAKPERVYQRIGGRMVAFRELDMGPIFDWNKKHDIVVEEELQAMLDRDTNDPKGNGHDPGGLPFPTQQGVV